MRRAKLISISLQADQNMVVMIQILRNLPFSFCRCDPREKMKLVMGRKIGRWKIDPCNSYVTLPLPKFRLSFLSSCLPNIPTSNTNHFKQHPGNFFRSPTIPRQILAILYLASNFQPHITSQVRPFSSQIAGQMHLATCILECDTATKRESADYASRNFPT